MAKRDFYEITVYGRDEMPIGRMSREVARGKSPRQSLGDSIREDVFAAYPQATYYDPRKVSSKELFQRYRHERILKLGEISMIASQLKEELDETTTGYVPTHRQQIDKLNQLALDAIPHNGGAHRMPEDVLGTDLLD